jgi:predicted ATPase/class 3 adenylate cyclase
MTMSNHSETFGRLLRGAINSIAAYEGKSTPVVEEEIGAQIGVAGSAIQRYKAGSLPPEPRAVAILAEAGVRRGFLARAWLLRFLQAARYPTPELLITQLADALGAPITTPVGGLPGGTVALLFTDIVGSTQQWEQQPRAMERALEHHDAILRQALDAYGGQIFKTVGDAFYAVFTTVPAALEAALSAQRSLQAESWGPSGALMVRMAIHVGAPQQRDGDYFGPPLNRLARLLSAGHGGQILLSLSAQELTHEQLPHDVSLRDLGEHRLKDLGRTERIFQVIVPGLPAEFPPLRSLDTYRHNLPPQATALIGREGEVEQLLERFAREEIRLLTLTGPGGIGKTRLALQVAAEKLDAYPDGVFFVSLATVRDPGLVAEAIARVIGLKERGDEPLEERLKATLRPHQALLVLDNFEQVLAAAPLIGELLAAAPKLKALATSREALHLYGEHEFAVPPLHLPDPGRLVPLERLAQIEAIRLFIERARAVRPDLTITEENAPVIAEICARLDGLPLAIELAAARSKLFPPKALLARLGQRLKVLTGGPHDLPARQQTLAGAIAWSYDLLDTTEQTLFTRLSVFTGGCTLEAAEAILGDDDAPSGEELAAYVPTAAVLDGLSGLVDRSLLRQVEGTSAEPRFVMLETIREFALERLVASGEAPAIHSRHAAYYMGQAQQYEEAWGGPGVSERLAQLADELPNLRSALDRYAAEGRYAEIAEGGYRLWWAWWKNGFSHEGYAWMRRVLAEGATALSPELSARATLAAGALAGELGVLDEARHLLEGYLAKLPPEAPIADQSLALSRLAAATHHQGETRQAQVLLEKNVRLCREGGSARDLADALEYSAVFLYLTGEVDQAKQAAAEGLELYRTMHESHGVGAVLRILGNIALDEEDLQTAEHSMQEAYALARQHGDQIGAEEAANSLGLVAEAQSQYALATRYFNESLELRRRRGDQRACVASLANLATTSLFAGEIKAAAALCAEATALCQRIGYAGGASCCVTVLGGIACQSGRYADGLRLLSAAIVYGKRQTFRVLQPKHRRRFIEQTFAAGRTALGEVAFEAACAGGEALSLERAIAEAYPLTGTAWSCPMDINLRGLRPLKPRRKADFFGGHAPEPPPEGPPEA